MASDGRAELTASALDDAAPPASGPPRRRARSRIPVLVALAALAALAVLVSLRIGSLDVSWHDAIGALTDYPGPQHAPTGEIVVRSLRLPRTLVGLAVGAALGTAGALMQGLTRNPLGDPGILGINAGAGLAVSAAIIAGVTSLSGYVWLAFVGAAVAAVIVYGLGSVGGAATPVKLALAGAVVAALLGSVTSSLNVVSPEVADISRFWLAGSLTGRSTADLATVSPFIVVGLLIALVVGRPLNGLSLGDDVARSLGQRVVATRVAVAVSVVLLAGASVAIAGPIAFIGLMVPHLARFAFGPDYRWIVPGSALLGPTVLLACDVVGRIVAEPGEIEVGIMTAVIGAPVFIFFARRHRLEGL